MTDGETAPVLSTPEVGVGLAERIHAGDPIAEKELVDTFRRGVLLVAIQRAKDQDVAKDLTRDTLIAAIEALRKGEIREPEKLAEFVQATARNVITSYLSTKTHPSGGDPELAELVAFDPGERLDLAEKQRLVRQELATFKPVDQKILLQSMVDGQSPDDIAQRIKLSAGTVGARKSKAVKKIIKKFAQVSRK